ncbi:MAG: hypothetical protein ACI4XA_01760 [Oscillospiraceae bacterium]
MKSALKFLFDRSFVKHPLRWAISTALSVAMLAAEFIWIVPKGEEDFLLSKLMFVMFMGFIPLFIMLFIGTEIAGSRFVRAVPFAKALYTRAVPVFSGMISYGGAAVFLLLYTAGVLIMGESAVQAEEMLSIMALTMPLYTLICGIASLFRWGVLCMIYLPFMYNLSVIFLPGSSEFLTNGLGIPLWAAALMFVGGAAASVAICCIVNSAICKKLSFRAQAETAAAMN